jgi:hypothetical protein
MRGRLKPLGVRGPELTYSLFEKVAAYVSSGLYEPMAGGGPQDDDCYL